MVAGGAAFAGGVGSAAGIAAVMGSLDFAALGAETGETTAMNHAKLAGCTGYGFHAAIIRLTVIAVKCKRWGMIERFAEGPVLFDVKDGQWRFNMEELRKKRVMIGTPMYGGVCGGPYEQTMMQLHRWLDKWGIDHASAHTYNSSDVALARNYIVAQALRAGATDVLWFDADQQMEDVRDALRLLAVNVAIVGCPVPVKSVNWRRVAEAVRAHTGELDEKFLGQLPVAGNDFNVVRLPAGEEQYDRQCVTVAAVGCGMMCVQSRVFETIVEEERADKFTNKHFPEDDPYTWGWFLNEINADSREYDSEDYRLCHLWRSLGGRVWLYPTAKVHHWGAFRFESGGIRL